MKACEPLIMGDWNKNVLAQQFGLGIHDDMMTFAKENKTFFIPNLMKVEHAFGQ